MPKISVIIPIFNVEKYIRKALDSVVNQTLSDIEIICVNDCTPDNSFEIVKEYASKDARFVLLEQETNQGQGVARNRALDVAKGDYIMFLDPDDWYELDACEKAYNQIEQNQNDMVLFSYYNYYECNQKKELSRGMLKPFSKFIDNKRIILKELDVAFFRSAYTVMYIYKRDFLNKNNIRYGIGRLGEDINFACMTLACCNNISILDYPLYIYRQREGSASRECKSWQQLIEVRFEIYKKMLNFDEDKKWFLKPFIVYYVNTLFYWFKIFSRKEPKISKEYYAKLRSTFIELDRNCDISQIKDMFSWKNYISFYLCIENENLFLFKCKRVIYKLFYIIKSSILKK